MRVNLPPGFEALERDVKAEAGARFNRGSLQVGLRIDMAAGAGGAVIDEALLGALIAATRKAAGTDVTAEAVAALMAVKGVVETGGSSLRDLAQDEAIVALLSAGAKRALDELAKGRLAEGAALQGMLAAHLDEIERLSAEAATHAATQPGLITRGCRNSWRIWTRTSASIPNALRRKRRCRPRKQMFARSWTGWRPMCARAASC